MSELTTDADREDLRAGARAVLSAKATDEQNRTAIASEAGYDVALWAQLASELGLHSMVFPEEHGGSGFGFVELGVVLSEMGRALLPGPFFTSVVLAGSALVVSGDDEARASYLPGIADGSTVATLAVQEADGAWRHDGFDSEAVHEGGRWSLTGEKSLVPFGTVASLIVVAATTADGPSLFAVEAGAAGLTSEALTTLDITRPLARLRFSRTPAVLIGVTGQAPAILDAVLDRATAALAAEQVGAARACLEMAVAYAKDRSQFGRQIGSFQAIKHKCADMFARIQIAEAAAVEAARAVDGLEDAPPVGVAAAVAHSVCSEAFMFAAAENIQVHGGIGFTWEHPAHLYFRRAKASQLMFGGPGVYHERLLQRMGV
ncbi:MAG: acrC8 [Marmoricola sp.]|nr:acrC8 [Marmoricola sp.]